MRNRPDLHRAALALAFAGVLGACAELPTGTQAADPARPEVAANPAALGPAAVPKAPTSAAGTPTRPGGTQPSSPALPPFATVIKEARRIDGALTLWQKDEKVWIELLPAQLGQPFLLSPKIKSGISEAWVLGGLMAYAVNGAGGPQVVEFVRVHGQVRLQARNTEITAREGTPEARAVADAYSHSLLGATPVVSLPHPERKSVLVEANGLFLSDLQGIGMMLQRGLRQGYALDGRNSVITAVRGSPEATVIETQNHYYSASVGTPAGAASPGAPVPTLPRFLPDTRSLLVGLHYSLAPLPRQPMSPRRADPRIGLFTTTVLDFSSDLQDSPRQRWVNRWRLEKKDPAAEVSEPVKPITFWIDRNVPLAYRETVRAAIVEWNKPFEKIGFSNAIVVQQQPDDAAFDTLDFGYASVRWMMNADPVFGAIGPIHVDPRTRRDPRRRHRLRRHAGTQDAPGAHADAGPQPARGRRHAAGLCRAVRISRWRRRTPGSPAVPARRAGGRTAGLRARRARRQRRDRTRQPDRAAVRDRLCQAGRHARGRPRPGPAPQLPCLARLHRGAAVRPRVHAGARHRGVGDGIQRRQPAAAGSHGRPALPDRARTLRLLGHRIRLQAPAARGGRRGRAHRATTYRRAQQRAAAGLRHRRGQRLRHRPRDDPARPRLRPRRLRVQAPGDRPRSLQAPGDPGALAAA